MAKDCKKNDKSQRAELRKLCAELGIPEDVAEEVIDIGLRTADAENYLRKFAAEVEAQDPEPNEQPTIPTLRLETIGESCTLTAISDIPLADMIDGRQVTPEWPPRIGHLQVQFGHLEKHQKDSLTRLFHGLQLSGARLKGRTADEPARPIGSHADAVKWLLEQM